jgi:hypothetical protein
MKEKMICSYFRFAIFLTLFLLMIEGCGGRKIISTPLFWEPGSGSFEVPNGYETYTIFFATDYDYKQKMSNKEIRLLKKHFRSFGKSIGERNLAVWIKNPDNETLNVELGKKIANDIYRWYGKSMEYYNGLYLAILKHNPCREPLSKENPIIVALFNKNAEFIIKVLNLCEARIRRGKVPSEAEIKVFIGEEELKSLPNKIESELIKDILNIIIKAIEITER